MIWVYEKSNKIDKDNLYKIQKYKNNHKLSMEPEKGMMEDHFPVPSEALNATFT